MEGAHASEIIYDVLLTKIGRNMFEWSVQSAREEAYTIHSWLICSSTVFCILPLPEPSLLAGSYPSCWYRGSSLGSGQILSSELSPQTAQQIRILFYSVWLFVSVNLLKNTCQGREANVGKLHCAAKHASSFSVEWDGPGGQQFQQVRKPGLHGPLQSNQQHWPTQPDSTFFPS